MAAGDEELFAFLDDLEQQAEALYAADREAELHDRARAAYQEVTLAARLAASVDHHLTLRVAGVGAVTGTLLQLGAGWCRVAAPAGERVVATAAIRAVEGASERALPEVAWSPLARLGLGSVLRGLADAGVPCVVFTTDGDRFDGVPLRVGGDFVELRTGAGPIRLTLVPFDAVAAIQQTG